MQVFKVNSYDKNFTGKIIYPDFMTPEIEKFKGYAHERISKLIEDKPFDIYVKSKKAGDKVAVGIKYRDKEKEPNVFFLYILYDAIKSVKDKMLADEVKEFMEKSITPKISEEIPLQEKFKHKEFIPRKIGLNSDISSRSKFKNNGSKYIKRG
ncbi:hypothetical protein J6O86_05380 [bacterium]|nr:hypothetical protein [bacterium]